MTLFLLLPSHLLIGELAKVITELTKQMFLHRRGTMELECPSYLGPIEKIRIGLDDSKGTLPWILVRADQLIDCLTMQPMTIDLTSRLITTKQPITY